MSEKTVLLMPRWAGTATSDFYPWLSGVLPPRTELQVAPLAPTPEAPSIEGCIRSLDETFGARSLADTVLVAHSVGNQAMMRWLAARPGNERARGFVVVAGWWDLDERWDTIAPFIDEPFNVTQAKEAAGPVKVFLSDNDPYTSDHVQNAQDWVTKMGASVTTLPGRAHFNEERFEELWEVLQQLLA